MFPYDASMIGGADAAYRVAQIGSDGLLADSMIRVRKRNRLANPGMRISQERGTASVAVPSGTAIYAVDQWVVRHNVSGLGLSVQQAAKVTPAGSPNRIRLTVTTGSTAAGSVTVSAPIEGTDVADLLFGTAAARPVSGRIGINAPAGTYTLGLRNGAANRFIGLPFTITPAQAGTDVVVPYTFPGDTAGTWAADTGLGLELIVTLSASTIGGTTAWAGNGGPAVTGQTSAVAATNAVIEVFDAALYEGTAPSFELPAVAEDLRSCQRFYEVFGIGLGGRASAATYVSFPGGPFRQPKRSVPTISLTSTTPQVIEVDQGYRAGTGSGLNLFNIATDGTGLIQITGFTGLGVGNQIALTQSVLAANARLI